MYPDLKLHIWQSGIHQNQLARNIGIDETLLSRIVDGYRGSSTKTRNRIAGVLHVNEEWLFPTRTLSEERRGRK